jgi:cation transport regulator
VRPRVTPANRATAAVVSAGDPMVDAPGDDPMPYNTIDDLPQAQTDQYNAHQKEAFLKAFNNAYREYGGDEHRAFAVAHAAAKRAGEKPGPG